MENNPKASMVIGSILSVPLFIISYAVVATVIYAALVFFGSEAGAGVNRWTQFTASIFAPVAGVYAAQWCCDHAFKAWNRWPALISLVLLLVLVIFVVAVNPESRSWWDRVLDIAFGVSGVGAGWTILIKEAATKAP
jgi:cell division protein FtsW (lipid II flippase)